MAGAACAVACAAAGLLVGCGSASKSAEVAAIEPYVSPYDWSGLVRDGEKLAYYENDALCSRWGIDVSEHQGNDIDWAAVADAGVQFAFARIGNRAPRKVRFPPTSSSSRMLFARGGHPGERLFLLPGADRRRGSRGAQFALDNLRETEASGATLPTSSRPRAVESRAPANNLSASS
ncbi:MAG: hypothetical protein ACLUW6_07365 [Coriobacteriaceae bacterium]